MLFLPEYNISVGSGGGVSKFRRSVIRRSPVTGPARQSVIISGWPSPSFRHRYFYRSSVIAILQFVTAILGPSVFKLFTWVTCTSLGHFAQTNINSYNINNFTASPPQTTPYSW